MHRVASDQVCVKDSAGVEGVLAWNPKEEMYSLHGGEGDRNFLRVREQDAPLFSLKLTDHGDTLVSASLNGNPFSLPAAQTEEQKNPT